MSRFDWLGVQVEKARNWFNRAVTLNPDIGDFWALTYKFECQHGDKDKQEDVLKRASLGAWCNKL
eukprot:2411807-Pyramimonas_sp.AAC.2